MMPAGEIALQIAAQAFAAAFNDAAAKLRGFPSFKAAPDETRTDIARMAAHFSVRYGRAFGAGEVPCRLAEELTAAWWDLDHKGGRHG